MAQVISTQATEIIKKHFPYYEEEFTNEYKIKLHACLFEYADYIANERVKNISSNTMLADSLPLSDLKQTLYEVNTLIAGWNSTEAEWTEWDKQVQQKVTELQLKLDGKEAVNFR